MLLDASIQQAIFNIIFKIADDTTIYTVGK